MFALHPEWRAALPRHRSAPSDPLTLTWSAESGSEMPRRRGGQPDQIKSRLTGDLDIPPPDERKLFAHLPYDGRRRPWMAHLEREGDPRVQMLVHCYFEASGNKKDAMRMYGYSEKSVTTSNMNKVWDRPDIQDAIARVQRHLKEEATPDIAERHLAELEKIAFCSALGKAVRIGRDGEVTGLDFGDLTEDERAVIENVELTETFTKNGERQLKTKVKFYSKQAALDAIARVAGLNNDKLDVTMQHEEIVGIIQGGRKRLAERKKLLANDVEEAEYEEVPEDAGE